MKTSLLPSLAIPCATAICAAVWTIGPHVSAGEGRPEDEVRAERDDAGGSGRRTAPALDFKVQDIDGKEVHLGSFQGKVLMLVNVASRCGLTDKQYAGLESLYRKYKDRGFEILAFPANNFGGQEPGTEAEIKSFCASKKVTFRLFSKISVRGDGIHPLYKHLTSKETGGDFAGEIKWNFQKFLLDREGRVVARFDPAVDPLAGEVTEKVEKALKQATARAEREEEVR